jgi:SAM-dependent methyltransferase
MKNVEHWKPTKYEQTENGYRGSRDRRHLAVSSRLLADLTVCEYSKHIPLYAKGRLADLGCGNVPLYGVYKDFIKDNICVDWGNSIHENRNLDLKCDLNTDLPLPDNTVDTVILSDVLEHIASPGTFLDRVARCLKPGGVIILNVPFAYWLHEEPFDYYRYTKFGLEHLFKERSFKIEKMIPLGSVIELVPDLTCKFFIKNQTLQAGLVFSVQQLRKLLGRIGPVKRILDTISAKMPMGYFVVVVKCN